MKSVCVVACDKSILELATVVGPRLDWDFSGVDKKEDD